MSETAGYNECKKGTRTMYEIRTCKLSLDTGTQEPKFSVVEGFEDVGWRDCLLIGVDCMLIGAVEASARLFLSKYAYHWQDHNLLPVRAQ